MKKEFEKFLEEKGISKEDYQAKEASEMADLFNEYQEKALNQIREALKEKKSEKEVNTLVNSVLEAKGYATAKQLEDLEEQILQIKDAGKGGAPNKSFDALLEEALKEAMPKLKAMKGNDEMKGKEIVMTIKAPVTMTTGMVGNAAGVTTPDSIGYQQVNGYATDVRPDAYIINFLDNGNTNRSSIPYMDKLPNEGTMEITAEGDLKPLISFSFELRYSQAEKIAGRVKVSEEALDDIQGLMTMIQNELRYEHDMAEQDFVFDFIGTVAPAFVAGDLAATTDNPSNYDAVRAAIYAVKIQTSGKIRPNAVLVNSADLYAMGAIKEGDGSGQYILPPFVMPDGTSVAGVRVVEVTDDSVPAGTFIVGDFRRLKRRIYKSFTIRIGQGIVGSATAADIASDFEKNMYTIIGESRQHLYIYENEKVGFIKSTFAAVKTAIEAPAPV